MEGVLQLATLRSTCTLGYTVRYKQPCIRHCTSGLTEAGMVPGNGGTIVQTSSQRFGRATNEAIQRTQQRSHIKIIYLVLYYAIAMLCCMYETNNDVYSIFCIYGV
jgi:hypothetical protein